MPSVLFADILVLTPEPFVLIVQLIELVIKPLERH